MLSGSLLKENACHIAEINDIAVNNIKEFIDSNPNLKNIIYKIINAVLIAPINMQEILFKYLIYKFAPYHSVLLFIIVYFVVFLNRISLC